MIATLADVKAHLNVTSETDDDLIEQKIAAAQNHIERLLGFKIEEEFGGQDQDEVPPALIECVCLLAGHWYENREATLVAVNAQVLPIGVEAIVNEYREWSWS